MASTDYNVRAARGQAYNLAVADAIENNKTDDTKYIYQRFIRYYELGQILQDAEIDELKEVLK